MRERVDTAAIRPHARMGVELSRTSPRRIDWTVLLLLGGAGSYLYLNLFVFPVTPVLLGGDQVYFWMDAQRMLGGERIYRDFFQFTPPGTDLVYLELFKLFGFHIWVTNAVVLVLGVILCWVCFALAREIMGRVAAILATALFVVLIYGRAPNATHHWFSLLAVMVAVKISMRGTNAGRVFLAGGLLGVASFFTQTHGAAGVLGFATFLIWRQAQTKRAWGEVARDEALLFFGYAAVLLLLSAQVIAASGWKQVWYWQVTYLLQLAVNPQTQKMGPLRDVPWRALPGLFQDVFLYLLLPIVYGVTLWRCWRERRNPLFRWDQVALLSLVGFFLLVEIVTGRNWVRLYGVSMAGIVLLVWTFDQMPKVRSYAVALLWIVIASLAVRQTISGHVHHPLIAELPGGVAATTPQAFEKLHWIMLRTKPGEYFLQAGWPGMYLPLQLRNPLYLDTVDRTEAIRREDVEGAIEQLDTKGVRFILWSPMLDAGCEPGRHCEDYLTPLRDYLDSRYTRKQVFPDGDAIWQRNEATGTE